MENLNNNIFTKEEYPPAGFILQKDVYTTNLLYANDQFPLTSLKKRLPFRQIPKKILNPSNSISIIHQNGISSPKSEKKNTFYLLSNLKPKKLHNKKLKFPLPKIKTIPLTNLNLYEEINKKDIKIQNMDDDLNISSKNGKKIFYRFKENKLSNPNKSNFPPLIIKNNDSLNNSKNKKNKQVIKKKYNDRSMNKTSLNQIINHLNDTLRNLKQIEINRKRSFIRDKFFSTQIYIENVMDSNNEEGSKSNRRINRDYNYYQ